MNSEFPNNPREELELRVTALLLGELSADEAAAVREAVAKDPELTRLHDDLNQTIHLVRQATTNAGELVTEQGSQLTLSEARRKKLLTHFAIPPLTPRDRKPKPLFQLGLLEWAAVLTIIAVIAALAVAHLGVARREKGQVATTTEQTVARLAADAGLERARAEVLAQTLSVPGAASNNLYSLNVVGYHNVPTTDLASVTPGAADGVPPASQPSTSGKLPMARGSLEQAGTPLATPPPEASAAAPAPTTPLLPVRQPQIALPSLADSDADSKANDQAFQKNHSIGSTTIFAGKPGALSDFDTGPRASSVDEGRRAMASITTIPSSEPEAIGVLKKPAPNSVPAPATPQTARSENQVQISGQVGGGISLATGLPWDSFAIEGATVTDKTLGRERQLFRERYGLGVQTEASNGRGGGASPTILTATPPPPSAAAGTDVAGFVTAPASVEKLVEDSAATAQSLPSVALEGRSLFVFTPTDDSANKVPTLENVPTTGSFFRSIAVAEGGAGGGSQPAQPTDALARMRPEANLHANFAEISTNSWAAPAFSYYLGSSLAQSPTELEPKNALSADQPFTGGLRVAPEGKDRLAESGKLGWAESAHQKPGNVNGVDASGFYAGVPAKMVENFGAIVLPTTPEDNKQPAGAKETKLATVPSRTLRLSDPGAAGQAKQASALVQEGKRLLEAGSAVEAEETLKAALEKDPRSEAAKYYLSFANESLRRESERRSEGTSKSAAIQVNLLEQQSAGKKLETKVQRNKPDSSSGFRAGLTQTDVLESGRLAGDMITRDLDALNVEKKRELDELMDFSRILSMKLEAEKTDRALPKTSMVEIMDRAQPAKEKTGFWRNLGAPVGGSFASTARVKVQQAVTDIEGMAGSRMNTAYDPFFIQTEFEAIQSEAVLGKVVDALKLDEAWAANRGGEKLNKADAIGLLKSKLDLKPVRNTSLVEIQAKSDKPDEAAKIANAVAEAYTNQRHQEGMKLAGGGIEALDGRYQEQQAKIRRVQAELEALHQLKLSEADAAGIPLTKEADHSVRRASTNAPIPQPEIQTSENSFSTFSLNVSDVSFKLAAASLEKGQLPDAASVRSEEFINAFDYRDPEPAPGAPIAFTWERVRYPFAHNRDLLRFSLKTAAAGRQAGRPLNIVLLLDNSGSMERADRVSIIREALRVLASQLQPQDKLSVITFSRTARLVADGISGDKAGELTEQVSGLTPQGGTNLEDAMNLAYQTATRHYLANGINRVVLLTDGAANLGNVEPEALKQKVEAQRKQGIALDCFGIGWEGFNDDLLEVLSRNGDGRYGFINSPEEAATDFAGQLAGALKVAASDVKVQVEFNPKRVTAYRQIGYAKHQLTKEQFRDNTVDAAEIAAQEAGNALYTVEVNPAGEGPLGTVRVRFKIPGTTDYREQAWDVPYAGNAASLEQSSPAMRLAATASAFSEWLVASPFAGEVTPDRLLGYLSGVPEVYGADSRPKKLEWMLRQAKSIGGKQ